MTDLFFLDDYQIEALLVCLVSSIVWAPIVLLVALSLAEKASGRALQAIWLGALLIAIAPSILAPGLAGIGISLRPGTEQLSAASDPNQSFTPAASIAAFAKSDRRAAALVQQNTARPSSQYGAAITARAENTRRQIASATPSTARAEKQSEISNPPILLEAEPAFVFPLVQRIEKMSKSDVTRTAALLYFYGIFLALLIWWAKAFGLSWVAFTAQKHRGDDLRKGVELWQEKLSIARPPSLKKTRHVSSVCVIGFFRPVVLIPEGIDRHVTAEDLEMMCAHELAHISRRDPVLFLATSFVRSLFWFNPFVKTISKQVENAAEEAADSQVISRGVDRRRYAECFIKGLRFASEQTMRAPTFTPTFTPDERSGRRKRLNAILGRGKENKSRQPITFGMMLGLGFAMAGAAMAQAALSVSPESVVNSPKVFKDLQAFFAEPALKETTSEKPSNSTPPPAPSLAAVDRGAREAKGAQVSLKSTSTMFASPSDGNRFSSIETDRAKLGRNRSNAVDDLLSVGKRQLSYEAAWSRINPDTHHELEINAKSGTPVVAISAGTVCEVEPTGRSENGPYISVRHKGGLVSTYQNVTTSLVSPGDKIVSGQVFALVGPSEKRGTASQIRVEIESGGNNLDPSRVFVVSRDPWASKRLQLPDTIPSLKATALTTSDARIGFNNSRSSQRKPVQLAWSPEQTRGALGPQHDFSSDVRSDAAYTTVLSAALRTTDAQAFTDDSRNDGSMESAFAKMEAELADAKARRATAERSRLTRSRQRTVRKEVKQQAQAIKSEVERQTERLKEWTSEYTKGAPNPDAAPLPPIPSLPEECCEGVTDFVETFVEGMEVSLETAIQAVEEAQWELAEQLNDEELKSISSAALDAAKSALRDLASEEAVDSLNKAQDKIAEQQAEIERLKAELAASERKDR